MINQLSNLMTHKKWLVGFDRDGTLVPYADRPEDALLAPSLYRSIVALSDLPSVTVAVISARSLRMLENDFKKSDNIICAGNYGLEMSFPNGKPFQHPEALAGAPIMRKIHDELLRQFIGYKTLLIDDHDLSLCVHWHLLAQEKISEFHLQMEKVADQFPEVKFRKLPTSYEILPDIEWDKGCAFEQIDHIAAGKDYSFLYVGDSEQDEPAFKWVNARQGVTVKVGTLEGSCAQFSLACAHDVAHFVDDLLALRKPAGPCS